MAKKRIQCSDDYLKLTYLRARFYSSTNGRYISIDPSRLEQNLYQYASSNPVNQTDPTGLFSRQVVADSFDAPDFAFLVQVWNSAGLHKWGWLGTLLSANEWDFVRVGRPVIGTAVPYVGYNSFQPIWLKDCKIMIGPWSVADYTNYAVSTPNLSEIEVVWRDTSASYYQLLQPGGRTTEYVEGANVDELDYPDFHSLDVGAWFIPDDWPINGGSLLVDRFGNIYASFGKSFGKAVGLSYSEGYRCKAPFSCDRTLEDLSDEQALYKTMIQWWFGACIQIDWGGCYFKSGLSLDLAGVAVFSAGIAFNYSDDVSYGIWLAKDTSRGWNWAFYQRLNGVRLEDLFTSGLWR